MPDRAAGTPPADVSYCAECGRAGASENLPGAYDDECPPGAPCKAEESTGTPPVERLLEAVEMVELLYVPNAAKTPGVPWATHEGMLHFGDASIKVWQLSDGRRILDADDVARFFGG